MFLTPKGSNNALLVNSILSGSTLIVLKSGSLATGY